MNWSKAKEKPRSTAGRLYVVSMRAVVTSSDDPARKDGRRCEWGGDHDGDGEQPDQR